MSKFAIASLQLPLQNKNNLAYLSTEISACLKRFPWVDMIVLGELNGYGSGTDTSQHKQGEFEKHFQALAKMHNIWLIPGSYYEKTEQGVFNTAPVINPDGNVIARYRKMFPFLPYEKNVCNGQDFVVFDIPKVGKVGLMICYDQWFPEVARNLAWLGAEVILCPTLTNTIDRPAELILAQSNAIVNQCYFINVNATGELGYGQSIILGPQGEIIYQANVGREIIPIEVDFQRVREVREKGLHGLGQTLKSFRDHPIEFPVYKNRHDQGSFSELGELCVPGSGVPDSGSRTKK